MLVNIMAVVAVLLLATSLITGIVSSIRENKRIQQWRHVRDWISKVTGTIYIGDKERRDKTLSDLKASMPVVDETIKSFGGKYTRSVFRAAQHDVEVAVKDNAARLEKTTASKEEAKQRAIAQLTEEWSLLQPDGDTKTYLDSFLEILGKDHSHDFLKSIGSHLVDQVEIAVQLLSTYQGQLYARAKFDKDAFLELKAILGDSQYGPLHAKNKSVYPEDWNDLVARHISEPSLADFRIDPIISVGALRSMAAASLVGRSLRDAKIVLAYLEDNHIETKVWQATGGTHLAEKLAIMIAGATTS